MARELVAGRTRINLDPEAAHYKTSLRSLYPTSRILPRGKKRTFLGRTNYV